MKTSSSRVQKKPQVCGGDASIHDTRHTVWGWWSRIEWV